MMDCEQQVVVLLDALDAYEKSYMTTYTGYTPVSAAKSDLRAALNSTASAESGKAEHPEAFCQRCRRPNPVWFAPNDLWNRVMREKGERTGHEARWGICCPSCFAELAEAAGVKPTIWRFDNDTEPKPSALSDSENAELLSRLEAWAPPTNPGPLIRWAAAHLRGELNEARALTSDTESRE